MIRIERIWLATEPLDMRAGTETVLARVVQVFGAVQQHCAYLFTNKRANRMVDALRDCLLQKDVILADETPIDVRFATRTGEIHAD